MLVKSQKLAYVFWVWMMAVLAVLVLLNNVNLEYFFTLSIIGFLIIVELSSPFTVRPPWKSRINIVIAIDVMAFTVIILSNMLAILNITLFK
jgi:hypothetical protein